MSKVIIYQSKAIAVKWCQTSTLGDKKQNYYGRQWVSAHQKKKNYYGKGTGVSVHQENYNE